MITKINKKKQTNKKAKGKIQLPMSLTLIAENKSEMELLGFMDELNSHKGLVPTIDMLIDMIIEGDFYREGDKWIRVGYSEEKIKPKSKKYSKLDVMFG